MRVLVTRPRPQAIPWVEALRAQGVDAQALPLIDIAPAPDAAALSAQWLALADHALVIFVSPNAVERFFAARPAAASWPASLLAAAPGPGTRAGAARCGRGAHRGAARAGGPVRFRGPVEPARGVAMAGRFGARGARRRRARLAGRPACVRAARTCASCRPMRAPCRCPRPGAAPAARGARDAGGSRVALQQRAGDRPSGAPRAGHELVARTCDRHRTRASPNVRATLGFGVVHEAPPTVHAVVAALQHATLQSPAS